MSVYGEGAYRCEQHGVVHPRPRGDLQLGARVVRAEHPYLGVEWCDLAPDTFFRLFSAPA